VLQTKDYIRERESVEKRLNRLVEEEKTLKLRKKLLNQLIAADGDYTGHLNGNGNGASVLLDCPRRDCDRVGENGFTTKNGLSMHLTKTHGATPKTKAGRAARAARQ